MGKQGAAAGIAVAMLLVVATVALAGHVPGAEPAPRTNPPNGPGSVAFLVGLVVAAAAVATLAVVTRWRQLGTATPSVAGRPDWFRGNGERPSRRAVIIALIVVAVWLLAVAWLSSLGGGNRSDSDALEGPTGTRHDTSSSPAPTPTSPRPAPADDYSHVLGYLSAATGITLLVLVVASVRAARARRLATWTPTVEEDRTHPTPEAASESLARAAEVGLAEVNDPNREPRSAIIACYAAMERELARVPEVVPQDFDTASEVLERAIQQHALGPDSATELVELFDEARFSPHVMDEGHREVAVRVLERVLGELKSLA